MLQFSPPQSLPPWHPHSTTAEGCRSLNHDGRCCKSGGTWRTRQHWGGCQVSDWGLWRGGGIRSTRSGCLKAPAFFRVYCFWPFCPNALLPLSPFCLLAVLLLCPARLLDFYPFISTPLVFSPWNKPSRKNTTGTHIIQPSKPNQILQSCISIQTLTPTSTPTPNLNPT